MRITTRQFTVLALAACTFVGAPGAGMAQEGLQPVTIRVSSDIPPAPHPTALAMEWFKKKVEETFPAGSEVRNFYAGALYKDADAMVALGEGNLEMGWLLTGKTAAVDPWLGIVVQPGVLTTAGAVHELENLETGKMLLNRLMERHQIEPFGFSDLSFALGVSGKERLLGLDTLKGKKIRTFAPAINPAVSSWGANPIVMGFGDVPSALESGVLDGVITTMGGWKSITEQTPYYTVAGIGTITFDTYWVGASKEWWDRLNEPTRAKLREIIDAAMQFQDEANWCSDQLAIQAAQASGPNDKGVYSATAEEARPLQMAIGTSVADFIKETLPDEADQWVDRYLEEGRDAAARRPSGSDPIESLDCNKYKALLKG